MSPTSTIPTRNPPTANPLHLILILTLFALPALTTTTLSQPTRCPNNPSNLYLGTSTLGSIVPAPSPLTPTRCANNSNALCFGTSTIASLAPPPTAPMPTRCVNNSNALCLGSSTVGFFAPHFTPTTYPNTTTSTLVYTTTTEYITITHCPTHTPYQLASESKEFEKRDISTSDWDTGNIIGMIIGCITLVALFVILGWLVYMKRFTQYY